MIDKSLCAKIRAYCQKHGIGSPSSPLTTTMRCEDFQNNYYTKKQLVDFCKQHGLSSTGLKTTVEENIKIFLSTGRVVKQCVLKKPKAYDSDRPLSLDRQVVHFKADPKTRQFIAEHVHASGGYLAYIQKWLKERLQKNESFSYQNLVDEANAHIKRKSAGLVKKVAHGSCQFNQFLMDAAADADDLPHTPKEGWQLVRDSEGEKTYARYKQAIVDMINSGVLDESL